MSESKRTRPHFELARIYQDGGQEVEQIELCNLDNVLKKGSNLKMARRGFIGLSALSTSALLAACGGPTFTSKPTPTPTPTSPSYQLPAGQAPSQGLDVRNGPGSNYDLLFALPGGTQFTIMARDATSSWFEIFTLDGQKGWVLVSLVILEDPSFPVSSLPVSSEIEPTPTSVPSPTPTSVPSPTPLPVPSPTPPSGGGGGGYCTCNEICVCIPIGG